MSGSKASCRCVKNYDFTCKMGNDTVYERCRCILPLFYVMKVSNRINVRMDGIL